MSVDRSDARPLHQQVAEALRQEIRGHDLPPGAVLPSEGELCARFGVARSVVRQAVAALAAEGLVLRSRGRPAVVAPAGEHRRMVQRATGLFEQLAGSGQDLRTSVVEIVADPPPPEVAAFLGTRRTTRVDRVRRLDGEPLSYVRTWLPAERVPRVSAQDLTDASLHRLLTTRYGLLPVSGRRQVRAVAADARLAAALEWPVGSPLLLLEGGTADQHGRPLEWFSTWHRGDRVVFDVEVTEDAETVRLGGLPPASARPAEPPVPAAADDDRARARELLRELERLLG